MVKKRQSTRTAYIEKIYAPTCKLNRYSENHLNTGPQLRCAVPWHWDLNNIMLNNKHVKVHYSDGLHFSDVGYSDPTVFGLFARGM